MRSGSAFEDLNRIALAELYDRLFPIRLAADVVADALGLAALVRRPHAGHLPTEQLLDGRAELRLRGVGMHLELVLAAVLIGGRRLLGDDWTYDRAMNGWHGLLLLLRAGLLGGGLLGRGLLRSALLGSGLRRRLRGGVALGLRRFFQLTQRRHRVTEHARHKQHDNRPEEEERRDV